MKNLLCTIDSISDYYLDFLEDVCNIESPTNFKDGVDKVGKYFINKATEKGWDVEILPQKVSGDAVVITMNKDSENAPFTISGHIDTVHPVGCFGTPAVRRDKENMYGPGVMDCKGGVVAGFLAMDALEKCGFKSRPVQLILQSDEENSSKTSNKETVKFMCEKSKGSVAFFNLEGHLKGTVVTERKGILRYKFNVTGIAVHSSTCTRSANAIAEACHKIIELEKMKDNNGLTCNCGVISGGTVANTVAEHCSFLADIRFRNNEELELVKEKVKEIAETVFVEGCKCEFEEISFRPAMPITDANKKLLEKMNEIYRDSGLPVLEPRFNFSGSDAAYITQCGIPCVDSIGTEGFNIHSTKEYIRLDSLKESAKRIASVIYKI